MPKDQGGATPATTVLAAAGITHTLHSYEHDPRTSSFGLEAAVALRVDAHRVFKTLLVNTGDSLAVGLVPVTRSLDLKAMASALGVKKLVMAEPAVAERSSGMVVGGISPIGQKRMLPTVLDQSMLLQATVLISAGRRGLDVELSPHDLAAMTKATFAPISRA